MDGCFRGRSLGAGGVGDAASSLLVQPPGMRWLGQAGAGPGAPAERGRGGSGAPGQPSKTGSLLQPEKLGHVHLLLCLLNDLYLSSVLKIKFEICIQRY